MHLAKLMKTRLLLTLACVLAALTAPAQQTTTAFTYQGRLLDAGVPANGYYDFQFTLHDAPTAGNALGTPVINERVFVTNGLFTTEIDFGAGRFTGTTRWLGMGARITESPTAFLTLPMRQALNSVPQSQFALVAGSVASGAITAGMIANNAVTTAAIADGAITSAKLDPALATSLGSGAVADSRLSANVPLLDRASQTFTGNANFGALNVRAANATLSLSDPAAGTVGPHGFIGQSGGLLQLGLFGTEMVGSPIPLPAPYKRSMFGMDTDGAVGTLERSFSLASSAANFRVTLDDGAGRMKFSDTLGQKLTLAADYGIGVQLNTLYSRSPGGFAWYRGGAHNDQEGNSGGGSARMSLSSEGHLNVAGDLTANNLPGINYTGGNQPINIDESGVPFAEAFIDDLSIRVPAAGYVRITAHAQITDIRVGQTATFYLTDITSGSEVVLVENSATASYLPLRSPLTYVLRVTGPGYVNLRTKVGVTGPDPVAVIRGYHSLDAIYLPVRYN